MKNLRFFIAVFSLSLLFTSFSYAQLGEQDSKAYMGTGTFYKPNTDLRAIYEISIYPIENLSEPQLPLPDKFFSVNANIFVMAEGAIIVNAVASHPWWQIENKRISKEGEISTLSFSINGRWNPLKQQTGDWPKEERGCSIYKIEYQINNPIFGLFQAINKDRYSFGIVLEFDQKNKIWDLDFGERPGYRFPLWQDWGTKNGKIAATWGSLKGDPK